MALSPDSSSALYHVIPNQDNLVNVSQIELEGDSEVASPPTEPPLQLVDSRIHLVYFILGCSVLLSWNGASRHILFC